MDQSEAELECDPASVGAARDFIEAALRVWHLDDLAEVATLLTSEVVTNAFLHARTAVRVVARRQCRELTVEVHDASPGAFSVRPAHPDAEDGRGLFLVRSLAAHWGVEQTSGGKFVWFSLVGAG